MGDRAVIFLFLVSEMKRTSTWRLCIHGGVLGGSKPGNVFDQKGDSESRANYYEIVWHHLFPHPSRQSVMKFRPHCHRNCPFTHGIMYHVLAMSC